MPSWNIHIAHAERLLKGGGSVARAVRDGNAFLFGNLIPDIYVGYMVPGVVRPVPYRVTHFAKPEHIPKPRAGEFFDAYVHEVRKHMEYENEKVFTYVEHLLKGERLKDYSIGIFARHHDQINAKLTELKNIIIKYYPSGGDNQLLNATLFDIFSCEEDLASHNRVEDFIFVPAIMELEKEIK